MITSTLLRAVLASAAFALPAFASSIDGEVYGTDGRPLSGAQVRFERKDLPTAPVVATTDGTGHYKATGLAIGLYRVSLVADGATRSTTNLRTAKHDARVDFDLRPSAGKKVKHLVWIAPETGTRTGGRWVEIENASSAAATTLNIDRKTGEFAREMMRHQFNNTRR